MKKFVVITAAALIYFGSSAFKAVNADAYTIASLSNIATLTNTTSTFTFTDPHDTFFDTDNAHQTGGLLTVTGDYSGDLATNVDATYTPSYAINGPTVSGAFFTDGSGTYSFGLPFASIELTSSSGATLAYISSAVKATATPGVYSVLAGGGSYTPAPESSGLISLGTLLMVGSLFVLTTKRRTA